MSSRWLPLVTVCLGAFMLLVDVTIVIVALPAMNRTLGTSFTDLQWVLDAYALAMAATLLGWGGLADRWGRRRTYLAGLGLFIAASLACGLADDGTLLIAARGVQGLAGAAMFASSLALLNQTYGAVRDRAIAYAVWGAVSGAAAGAGPVLGGLLTEHLSWRAVFLVNLPVGIFTVVLAVAALPESPRSHGRSMDVAGACAFTVAAGALTYGLIRAGDQGWSERVTLIWFAVALAALLGFVTIERRRREPMLDLTLFRRPAFTGVMLAAMVVSLAAFGYTAYTSLWLQSSLGMSPVSAGLAMLPMSGAAFVTSAATAKRLASVSPRVTITLGLALVGVGAFAQTILDAGSSWATIAPGLAIAGVGVGIALPHLNSAAMGAVPVTQGGVAAGALNTARQLGMALGIAALGTAFSTHADLAALADRAAVTAGLNLALGIAGAVALLSAGVVIPLLKPAPALPRPPAADPYPAGHQT